MASYLDKIEVNSALTESTKLDLGHVHITTANFMQLNPVLCKEMVPGEKADCSLMTFSRMQPLAVPTFGRANIKERAFFVPFRTIFKGWNDFITDTPHVFSDGNKNPALLTTVPYISNTVLAQFFGLENVLLTGTNYVVATKVQSTDPYDIVYNYLDSNNNLVTHYMHLTREGRQCLKVLESLGYKIVYDARNTDTYSALPILALAKIYMDWYFPSAYANTAEYAAITALLNRDSYGTYDLSLSDLQNILSWITYVNYDSDYLISAWDNPVAPNSGVYSDFKLVDITVDNAAFGSTATSYGDGSGNWRYGATSATVLNGIGVSNEGSVNGTPTSVMNVINTSGGQTAKYYRLGQSVSEYQHDALKKLTDYMKRHQLVGARAMDRYLARFGKALDADKLNRCNYIGSKMVPLQIGDVMSTADTSAAGTTNNLGSFAGKGMAFEEGFEFDWSTDEYGYLMVMSSIVPAAGNYQGLDRKVTHLTKLSFWTPEFDSLGVQAISMREVYNNYDPTDLASSTNGYMSFNGTAFGFSPRYSEYKFANDQLTGDFVVNTYQNNDSSNSSWHLMRMFSDKNYRYASGGQWVYDYSLMSHSRSFMQGLRDHRQFDRIFSYAPADANLQPDPFTIIYDFNLVSYAPMKSLYDTYEFDDKGRKVSEEVNGVKMN